LAEKGLTILHLTLLSTILVVKDQWSDNQ